MRFRQFNLCARNNGNVLQITNNRDTLRTQIFAYDALNRIQQANSSGPNWGETFTIDAWGNLTNRGPVGKTNYESLSAAPASGKNQLNGFCNDAAGNLVLNVTCPTGTLSPIYNYDAENRLTSTAGYTYVYDGDGKRVKKCNSCASATGGTLYWTGMGSDNLSESDLGGTIQKEYIFFNGKRVARRDVPGTPSVKYYFSDHLGSASVVTNATGAMPPLEESDYYPYGGEMAITNSDPNQYKFAGKERDNESGLDYFGARHYGSMLSRFSSVDPKMMSRQRLSEPQQWNMYGYVANNPLKMVDPDGKEAQYAVTGNQIKIEINVLLTGSATAETAKQFQQDANRALGGTHVAVVNGQKYSVIITVNASTNPKALPNPQTHGQNTMKVDNSASKTEVNPDGKTGSGKSGELATGNVAGHEALHYAGLKDEYISSGTKTVVNGATGENLTYGGGGVPLPGAEGDIMANPKNPGSTLTQQNVNQLGEKACQIGNCKPGH